MLGTYSVLCKQGGVTGARRKIFFKLGQNRFTFHHIAFHAQTAITVL